jgi:uncharacterized protein YebE (UPF0316 family)
MEAFMSANVWLGALLIFFARLINLSVDTMRVFMVVRGRKGTAWILGFIQTVIYVLVFSFIIQDITNIINLVAYAGGFATGNVVGMWIEGRMAVGHLHLRVISPSRGAAISERLREEGFAVTEISGRGKDGMVTLLNVSVMRRDAERVQDIICEVDENAFISAEELRPIQRGFWGR